MIDVAQRINQSTLINKLLYILTTHSLVKNPVGGIGEIFDGDAEEQGESVGALFQLWSMAEFVRSLVYSTTGFQANPIDRTLYFNPLGINSFRNYQTTIHTAWAHGTFKYDNDEIHLTDFIEDTAIVLVIPKQYIGMQVLLNGEKIDIDENSNVAQISFKSTEDDIISFAKASQDSSSTTESAYFLIPLFLLLPIIIRRILQYFR